MGIQALDGFSPQWYTPKSEDGEENPTRFKLLKLDGEQIGYIRPEVSFTKEGMMQISGRGEELVLKYGIIDWENFTNTEGKVTCVSVNHRLIPAALRAELAGYLIDISILSKDQRKNSSSQSK